MNSANLTTQQAANAAIICANARGDLAQLLKFRLPPKMQRRVTVALNEMHVLSNALGAIVRNEPKRRSKRKRPQEETLIGHIKRRSRMFRTIREGIKRGREMATIPIPSKVKKFS